jgi:hypothetical protein
MPWRGILDKIVLEEPKSQDLVLSYEGARQNLQVQVQILACQRKARMFELLHEFDGIIVTLLNVESIKIPCD